MEIDHSRIVVLECTLLVLALTVGVFWYSITEPSDAPTLHLLVSCGSCACTVVLLSLLRELFFPRYGQLGDDIFVLLGLTAVFFGGCAYECGNFILGDATDGRFLQTIFSGSWWRIGETSIEVIIGEVRCGFQIEEDLFFVNRGLFFYKISTQLLGATIMGMLWGGVFWLAELVRSWIVRALGWGD